MHWHKEKRRNDELDAAVSYLRDRLAARKAEEREQTGGGRATVVDTGAVRSRDKLRYRLNRRD